jgi:integrase
VKTRRITRNPSRWHPVDIAKISNLVTMSGYMRSRSHGVWEVRVSTGRDPVTKRQREISRTVRGTRRDAQKVLNELVVEVDKGQYTGTSTTFAQLCEKWITLAKSDLSPVTIRSYESHLRKHILPAFGDRPLRDIKTVDIDSLYHSLQQHHQVTPSTVRHIHAVIRRAFRQAVIWDWIATNPADNVTQPRPTRPDLSPPSVQEVDDILRAADKCLPEFGRFLHVAATTGARRGELCALRWGNVDFGAGTLSIERAVIEVTGRGVIEKDTKTHTSRRIALDEGTLSVLGAQHDVATERAAVVGLDVEDDAFIFSREPDGLLPWRPDYVTKSFTQLRDGLGFANMRLHDLRHFTATRLIAAGVPVRTVSGRLGHANPSTTLSVYSHFVDVSDRDAAGVMGQLVTRQGRSKSKPAKASVKKAVRSASKR